MTHQLKTRDGRNVDVPDGREYVWPPNRMCPQCRKVAWRTAVDKNGQVTSHIDQLGQRFICTGHPDAKTCGCGAVRITRKAGRGWTCVGERWLCGACSTETR